MNQQPSSDHCPKCGMPLRDIQRNFHVRTIEGPHIHGFHAYCESCHLPYKRTRRGNVYDSGWFSSQIEGGQIRRGLTIEELELLEREVEKYRENLKRWQEFRSYEQEGDRFHFYEVPDLDSYGIVMVRKGDAVLAYDMHPYLLKKSERRVTRKKPIENR